MKYSQDRYLVQRGTGFDFSLQWKSEKKRQKVLSNNFITKKFSSQLQSLDSQPFYPPTDTINITLSQNDNNESLVYLFFSGLVLDPTFYLITAWQSFKCHQQIINHYPQYSGRASKPWITNCSPAVTAYYEHNEFKHNFLGPIVSPLSCVSLSYTGSK